MTSAGRNQLRQQLARVANVWPSDPFRPNLQLKTFLESLATHPNLTEKAVAAAQALARDDVKKRYPLTDKMLKPASSPRHYELLSEGYVKAQMGIKRPLWKRIFNVR